jgi:hypothetical protein
MKNTFAADFNSKKRLFFVKNSLQTAKNPFFFAQKQVQRGFSKNKGLIFRIKKAKQLLLIA